MKGAWVLAFFVALAVASASTNAIAFCYFPEKHCPIFAPSVAVPLERLQVKSDILSVVREASATFGVEENLILAIIKQESNFNPKAVSTEGACGLMQIMPGTARETCPELIRSDYDFFDIRKNVLCGTEYLSKMLRDFGGRTEIALAAYNAGPTNTRAWLSGGKRIPEEIPVEETRNYVPRVMNYYQRYA